MNRFLIPTIVMVTSLGLIPEQCLGQGADYQLYRWGSKSDKACQGRGGVFLGGGGRDVDEGMKLFVKNAGGGDIVVLRASGSDGYQEYLVGLAQVNSVVTIVFKSRKASFDKRVLEIIKGAEAIFLAGGRQDRYFHYWQKTPVAKLLRSCHERNVVLGGTSAGLAVLGEFCFAAREGGVTSETLLKNPVHKRVSLEKGFIHSKNALFRSVLFDSHFSERKRLGRLLVFLATLRTKKLCANPIGIGIDEATALFVDRNGYGEVFGRGRVQIVSLKKATVHCQSGQPLSVSEVKMARLPSKLRFYGPIWAISGGKRGILSAKNGVLSEKLTLLTEKPTVNGPHLGQLGQPLTFVGTVKGSPRVKGSLLIQGKTELTKADSKGACVYTFQKTGRYQVHFVVDETGSFPILSKPQSVTIKP